jgi:hypothetical protein
VTSRSDLLTWHTPWVLGALLDHPRWYQR